MTQLRHTIPDELNEKIIKVKIELQKKSPNDDITFTDALIHVLEKGLSK